VAREPRQRPRYVDHQVARAGVLAQLVLLGYP
jgi:hypothetical protein